MNNEQQFQQQLDQRLAGLSRDLPPAKDLWPELAGRLAVTPQLSAVAEPARFKIWQKPMWQAALAAAATVLLWVSLSWPDLSPDAVIATVPAQQSVELATLPGQTQWQLVSEFEQQKARQLAKLRQVPEFYQDWQQQLQIWQHASQQVLAALEYQPDEPVLLRQLVLLQQQQLTYLQKVVQADLS